MISLDKIVKTEKENEYELVVSGYQYFIRLDNEGKINEIDHGDYKDDICPLCHFKESHQQCPIMELKYRKLIQDVIFSLRELEKILKFGQIK